jgi:hypothetical protein
MSYGSCWISSHVLSKHVVSYAGLLVLLCGRVHVHVKQHLIEKNEYARSAINTIYGLDAEEASKISGWCVVAAKLASSDQSMDFRLTCDHRAEPHAIHTAQGPDGRNMSSNSSSGDTSLPSSSPSFVAGTDTGPCTTITCTRPFVKANRMTWKYSKFPHASVNEGHINMDAGAVPEVERALPSQNNTCVSRARSMCMSRTVKLQVVNYKGTFMDRSSLLRRTKAM